MKNPFKTIFGCNSGIQLVGTVTKVLFVSLFLLLSSISISLSAQALTKTNELHIKHNSGSLLPVNSVSPNAKQVTVGIYSANIYDMDLRANTFNMSFYIWLRWNGDFDPVSSLEFTNVVDNWGLTIDNITDSAQLLKDGSKYQAMHVGGRFFQPFDLHSYPLDKQELSIYVENSNESAENLVYIPDSVSTGYSGDLLVPGWKVKELNVSNYIRDYGTDFGEVGLEKASTYSTVKFSFKLERYANFFIWKMMLPLIIVLMTNWIALLLTPTLVEVRTAMPASALLTCVFMRQSALDAIPECPSLVLMDQIYVMAYICIVLTLIQIIWINIKIDKNSPESISKMKKIDTRSFVAQIVGFMIVLAILIIG
jgi:hypothetical protein